MAIYISRKAVEKLPDELKSNYLPQGTRSLSSNHFGKIPFFKNLAVQGQGADTLKNGDNGPEVIVLQSAIKTVASKLKLDIDTLVLDGIFGDNTKKALQKIQKQLHLTEDGKLTSETLFAIDNELTDGLVYDEKKGDVFSKGKVTGTLIVNKNGVEIVSRPDHTNVELGSLKGGIAIPIQDSNNDYYTVRTDNATLNKNLNNNSIGFIKKEGVFVAPHMDKPEPSAKLVQVEQGETLISIIYREYYKESYGILKNPNIENPDDPINDKNNPDNLIHKFPQRELKKDTRLRFLVNLLFYMNHNNSVANKVDFIAPYEKYSLDHLDNEYIYDNTGYKLNYQVFLEKLTEQNPNYNWPFVSKTYTVEGHNFSFDAPIQDFAGDLIWIPSRTYVEGLYYSLNFCPTESRMYQKKKKSGSVTPDNPEGDSFFDWIDLSGFTNFITTAEKNLRDIVQYTEETISDVIDTYKEARTFFINMHEWLNSINESFWPRGFGTEAEGGVHISAPVYGVPLTFQPKFDFYVWREMTSQNQFVIKFREKSLVKIGLEVGVGKGFTLGRKTKRTQNVGSGNAKREDTEFFYGLGSNVTGALTLDMEVISIYEFDISKEDTALLAMTIAMVDNLFGSAIENTKLASNKSITGIAKQHMYNFVESYFSVNIDPNDYLVQQEAAMYLDGRIYTDAYIGNVGKEGEWIQENVDKKDKLKPNKLFGLLKHLNMGGDAELAAQLGAKYTYKAEYKNIPNLYTKNLRLPSKASIEREIFASATASLNINFNNQLVRYILGAINMTVPITIIPSFNLDTGIAFIYNVEYTRKKIAVEHTYDHHYVDESQLYSIHDPNNRIVKTLGFKIDSGDLDNPLGIGSETSYWLEFAKLKEYIILVRDSRGDLKKYVTNLDILLSFFHKVTIRKRLQPTEGVTNRSSKSAKNITEKSRNKARRIYKRQFKDVGSGIVAETLDKFRKSLEIGLDIEASIEMKEALSVIKFVYEYLRFVVSKIEFTGNNRIAYEEIETKVTKLICSIKDEIALATPDNINKLPTVALVSIFEKATIELEKYYTETENFSRDTLKPYVNLVGDFIKILDTEGVIDGSKKIGTTIYNTASPYITEIREVLFMVIKYLLPKAQINMLLEGKLDFGTGGSVKAGIGLKAEMGFFIGAGLYSNFPILAEGKIAAIFDTNDPYFDLIKEIIKLFGKVTPEALEQSTLLGDYLIANSRN